MKPKIISYTYIIGDLFHYGHLRLLENAKKHGDYHICGVIDQKTAENWESILICNYQERSSVVDGLVCVDEVIPQCSMDPTQNLNKIHRRFPEAKIILFQGHQKSSMMPGVDYIKNIGGEVLRPDYYDRLSRDNIAYTFINGSKQASLKKSGQVNIGNFRTFRSKISTKANTLKSLEPRLEKARIERLFIFTVKEWNIKESKIIESIENIFNGKKIVIRSSSQNEDLEYQSNAGHYCSFLNINSLDRGVVRVSINKIIEDYIDKDDEVEKNQILVQLQTEGVAISGVVFTRNPRGNTPYYLINYDDTSQATDTVTGGVVGKKIEILREIDVSAIPLKWKKLIEAIKELESIFSGMVLDIEFAITERNEVVIFQVRPLVASRKYLASNDKLVLNKVKKFKKKIAQSHSSKAVIVPNIYWSDMSFWNPSEIIGDYPNYLDYSLYNKLILKKAWNISLLPLGYTEVASGLMLLLGNKPYINVHHSFLSLLPSSLSLLLKKKLLEYYNRKIKEKPFLHDKIEFEIVYSCFDFSFYRAKEKLLEEGFDEKELDELETSLKEITKRILIDFQSILEQDLKAIKKLAKRRKKIIRKYQKKTKDRNAIKIIKKLLNDCEKYGTIPFSRMARMGFIGKSLLYSLKKEDPHNSYHYDDFYASITTVATELEISFDSLYKGGISLSEFMDKYGHLRPGTYDITQLPYRLNDNYFNYTSRGEQMEVEGKNYDRKITKFDIPIEILNKVNNFCEIYELEVDGHQVFNFINMATKMREYFKFEFTKNLSEAIEYIAQVGEFYNFTRDDLAHLDLDTFLLGIDKTLSDDELINIWKNIIKARKQEKEDNGYISLPSLIFSPEDLVLVPTHSVVPNFITEKEIIAEIVNLNQYSEHLPELQDKIVLIEKADPGYDWIFTHRIGGLITKYGGAASHMAIRCAEFDIPAAIGCGDSLFVKALSSNKLYLNCKKKTINFI